MNETFERSPTSLIENYVDLSKCGLIVANIKEKKVYEETIRHELEGNFCRCTGYQSIVDSIVDCLKNSDEKI